MKKQQLAQYLEHTTKDLDWRRSPSLLDSAPRIYLPLICLLTCSASAKPLLPSERVDLVCAAAGLRRQVLDSFDPLFVL